MSLEQDPGESRDGIGQVSKWVRVILDMNSSLENDLDQSEDGPKRVSGLSRVSFAMNSGNFRGELWASHGIDSVARDDSETSQR